MQPTDFVSNKKPQFRTHLGMNDANEVMSSETNTFAASVAGTPAVEASVFTVAVRVPVSLVCTTWARKLTSGAPGVVVRPMP